MTPVLALEKISKRFGAVVVAREIDLALAEGEALGIIGPNGAGKTTLFGIASGTVAPDSGRVILAGEDITRLAPERRCRLGIGRSFQIPQPFHGMSVFENLVVAAAFGGNGTLTGHGELAGETDLTFFARLATSRIGAVAGTADVEASLSGSPDTAGAYSSDGEALAVSFMGNPFVSS